MAGLIIYTVETGIWLQALGSAAARWSFLTKCDRTAGFEKQKNLRILDEMYSLSPAPNSPG
jgi:hypothetical protein